jgi:hypothetical protein
MPLLGILQEALSIGIALLLSACPVMIHLFSHALQELSI